MSTASSIRKFVKDQQRGSLAELKDLSRENLREIRNIYSNIADLTGIPTEKAVENYIASASQYFEDALGRGREDVYGFEPRGISESASVMKGMIDPALDQYSLMNRDGFMSQALNPSVVEIDPSKIFGSLDYSTKGYSTANPLLDYRDAASQAMIQGRRGAIEQQADFYANDPNVKGLMTYNV